MGVAQGNCQKPTWKGGHIVIQLQDNTVSFVTGQVIQGIVHVNLQRPSFESQNITIGLHGSEYVYYTRSHTRQSNSHSLHSSHTANHNGSCVIIDSVFPLYTLVDGPLPAGQYSFPFSLQVPEWLPASVMFDTGHSDGGQLSISYHLRA